MKLWIFSDLHEELGTTRSFPDRRPDADIALMAGDWTHADKIEATVKAFIEKFQMPVVYVAGNHEFYGSLTRRSSLESDQMILRLAEKASEDWDHRLYVLDEDTIVIEGVRFIGATLWVDFLYRLSDVKMFPARMRQATNLLADFEAIRLRNGRRYEPAYMLSLHRSNAAYIRRELEKPFDGLTIVLTHHLPHPDCTPEIYRGAEANYLFCSSEFAFGNIFESADAPALWVCGHTHHALDVEIGRTRVVCNPLGYWWEQRVGNGFRGDLVIDTNDLIPQPTRRHP
nr:metallophosphoesterase [Brucella intermedia]